MPVLPVIVRWWFGDLLALFPTVPADRDCTSCASYALQDGWAAADYDGVIAASAPASPAAAQRILRELRRQGVDNLALYRRRPRPWDRGSEPTARREGADGDTA